ncbi:MAG TPA: DUF1707 and DUF4190 domain-containing protein [Streptosporangiaceae bacterium]|nr:DUF1707 and DUF4190 domain-containing protein [Streptosporangiaceae bacterium]
MSDNDGGRGKLRASDTDRDRVVELLSVAYSEGRLSKDEYDGRLENAFSARTYADLDQIVTDLPVVRAIEVAPAAPAAPVAPVAPVAKVNALAIASLACGVAQFAFGPLATIPAIALGHVARHQIKRSGEQGAGLALAGLILGWAAVILGILILVLGVAMSARMQGTMH